jgi:hypothetical protein
VLAFLAAAPAASAQGRCENGWEIVLEDRFDGAALDRQRWAAISEHDFRSKSQEISEGALRLEADTLQTDDRTVKRVGVAARPRLDLRRAVEVEFDLDWNNQANGSYLTAGAYMGSSLAVASAESVSSWVKVEYIGVPPGRNGRAVVSAKTNGQLRLLHTEGWPDRQKTGRPIGRVRVRMRLEPGRVAVFEDGQPLMPSLPSGADFPSGYLHLEMSSHSNYPARSVRFDNVVIRQACD